MGSCCAAGGHTHKPHRARGVGHTAKHY